MKSNLVVIFVVELVLLYLIAMITYYIFTLMRKIKINDRLDKYTIKKNEKETPIFEEIFEFGHNIVKGISKILYKSKFLEKYSLRYQKYIKKEDKNKVDKMDFVSKKFLIAIFFIIVVVLYDVFRFQDVLFIQIIIAFLFGFYTLDLLMISPNKILEKKKHNDLLRAITIMNNSFKSGHSIMQSIKLVSDELDSELGLEFKKMYVDLTYGLSLDATFKRFESRVEMDEVKYITTSLKILNETGGDIVKVFESVEKTFFNNKKLNDELNNLTAASKMLYTVLLCIPVLFILVIYFLDNTYFMPLFSNVVGYIVVIISIMLYITYIIVVKKVMKVGDKL